MYAELARALMKEIPSSTSFGVMQGRLSPPPAGHFQAFPRETWREEIALAPLAGFTYIEWIHDAFGESANPIFTPEGRAELAALKQLHGIATPAICGDWFMDNPLIRCPAAVREEREQHLHDLLPIAHAIGATRLVLPFVDAARIATESEKRTVLKVLERGLPVAEQNGIELHLEADFPPAEFADFLARLPHPFLKVNWDSGNSSGLGYLAHEEMQAYGHRLGSVHIKDRLRKPGGGIETRPLGTGSADFPDVFASLARLRYTGGITLQVARGQDGDEVDFLRAQLAFVASYWH